MASMGWKPPNGQNWSGSLSFQRVAAQPIDPNKLAETLLGAWMLLTGQKWVGRPLDGQKLFILLHCQKMICEASWWPEMICEVSDSFL